MGLLNVGTEEHKGRAEIKVAAELIARVAPAADFEFVGFVEGVDLPSDKVDVIVTDGFTGNVALKTGEGTARMIRELMGGGVPLLPAQPHRGPSGLHLPPAPVETDRSAAGSMAACSWA